MSNHCQVIAQRRKVGSSTRKAVLMYLADRASDDGSGVWTSKGHIAADTELSKRSVQQVMTEFEAEGIIQRTGKKACQNGFTVEYRIVLGVLSALPSTRDLTGAGDSPVQEIHPTGAGDSPQGVQEIHPNHPLTTHEPSNARERADDLFSAESEDPKKDETSEWIGKCFEIFWKEIWPSHARKAGKVDCLKVYKSACIGKHPKAEKISPDQLNAAAKRFIASVKDREFLPGPLPWLRKPGWEPFIGGDGPGKPMTYARLVLRDESERAARSGR